METKHGILLIAIVCFAIANIQTKAQKTLTIEKCLYPLEIVQGRHFQFPDSLEKYDLSIEKSKKGYIMKGIGSETIHKKTDIINGELVNSHTGNSMIIDSNVTIKQINYQAKTLKIVVPRNINLKVTAENNIKISAPIRNLQLWCGGSVEAVIEKAADIKNIDITMAANVTINNCKRIENISISNAGSATIQSCHFISNLTVSGVGVMTLPKTTIIGSCTVNGAGEIIKK